MPRSLHITPWITNSFNVVYHNWTGTPSRPCPFCKRAWNYYKSAPASKHVLADHQPYLEARLSFRYLAMKRHEAMIRRHSSRLRFLACSNPSLSYSTYTSPHIVSRAFFCKYQKKTAMYVVWTQAGIHLKRNSWFCWEVVAFVVFWVLSTADDNRFKVENIAEVSNDNNYVKG